MIRMSLPRTTPNLGEAPAGALPSSSDPPCRRALGLRVPPASAAIRVALLKAAIVALLALVLPAAASAAPTVTVRGRAVPIPGFPHTGNYFGAGAAVHAEVRISGNEYAGFPPPLIGINVYLPAGVHLHPSGFPTCPPRTILEEHDERRSGPKAAMVRVVFVMLAILPDDRAVAVPIAI